MSLAAVLTKANSCQKSEELKQRKGQLHDQRVSAVKLILVASNTLQCSTNPVCTSSKWVYASCYHNPGKKMMFFPYSNCIYFCGIIEEKQ